MSDLYINKRIDSLGRIVIPKEIRKRLRILENENLDITYDEDRIIIKKSSDDLFDIKIFSNFIESIKKVLSIDVGVFNISKKYYGKLILKEEEFKDFILNKKLEFENYCIVSIYPNGILYGGLIVEKEALSKYNQIFECFKTFLEKYLEE